MIEFKRTPYRVILVQTREDAEELIDALKRALEDNAIALEYASSVKDEATVNQRVRHRAHLHNLLNMLKQHYTEETPDAG